MVSAIATPTLVRHEIDTGLSDADLEAILDRVARDAHRAYVDVDDPDEPDDLTEAFDDVDHRRDFEVTAAAYRIATGRDRRAASMSGETFSVTYEASVVARLGEDLTRLDPGDEFSVGAGLVRDDSRFVGVAEQDR